MILNINTEVIRKIAEKLPKRQLISKLPFSNSFKRLIAFTLAEVLITLMIIGVVASLTIPVVTRKIQDAQHKTAWKKTYSVINQATNLLLTDKGRDDMVGLFTSSDNMRDLYLPYLKYIKVCNAGSNLGNCWNKNDGSAKYLDGSDKEDFSDDPGIILADGVFVRFVFSDSACQGVSGSIKYCGYICFDTNGFKGPNTIGKDILYTWVIKDSIIPWGTDDDTENDNTCKTNDTGHSCAAEFLYK